MHRQTSTSVFTSDRYTSPRFHELEKERVFGACWIVVARDSDLPRPGDCLPVDYLDQSLLLARGEDGLVRAFHNSCRHRGTRLVSARCASPRIECPYHGWIYGLDGRVLGIPGRTGFDDLDQESLGLRALRCESWGGFVWTTSNVRLPPVTQYLGELTSQLAPYHLEEMRPIYRRTWTLPCNWKAILDQATETYHLRMVHGRSVGRLVDAVFTFHGHDPHHLQTIPVADYWWREQLDKLSVSGDRPYTRDQLRLFHKYLVFPNTLLNVMPYHLTVFRVFPITADTCRFDYEFHVRERAGVIGRLRGWLTLLASLYILREDFSVLGPFQAGVKGAGDETISFNREERALPYFHSAIDRHIGEGGAGICGIAGTAESNGPMPDSARGPRSRLPVV